MKKTLLVGMVLAAAACWAANPRVNITGIAQSKFSVSVNVANSDFAKCLAKNLELSGVFSVAKDGSIQVMGSAGSIVAEGSGKRISSSETFADAKSARMAARKFSDAMVAAWGQQKGFACDKIAFLCHGKQRAVGTALPGDICTCYPDGFDIRRLTNDGKMSIFPRWKGDSILFISDRRGAPQIWELNTTTEQARLKWSFRGTPTGIAVSPDGSKVAAILSFQGNPELYVLEGDRYTRLTTTKFDVEGQPTWSPDGKKIAFVRGDKTQQIWVIDVATKQERRLTSVGRQNLDPDWGPDGRITYITRRGGAQVAVMKPADGDKSAQLVTEAANWEHPSWSRDGRHVTANRDRALFVIDTLEGGDAPRRMFFADGDWISPCWSR